MNLPVQVTRGLGSAKFTLQKHGPTLMAIGAAAGVIVTVAEAIRATNKAQQAFEEIDQEVKLVKLNGKGETDTDVSKRVLKVYLSHSRVLAKIYWPTAVGTAGTVTLMLVSHTMMKRRQAGLIAAYTMMDTAYKAYRARVAEIVGEEDEKKIYNAIKTKPIEGGADGLEACEIDYDDNQTSPYFRFFDPTNPNWVKTSEYNRFFIQAQQNWANDRLHATGFVFLNEVLENLGFERTQIGAVVGWRLNGDGDGYIDFGMEFISDENVRAFVNGLEPVVRLDFNVDGIIWNKI
jgi:hypothetical protein